MKQSKALAFETDRCKNATEEQSSPGNRPVGQSGEPPLPVSNGHQALPQSLRRGTSADPASPNRSSVVRLSIYASSVSGPNWRTETALLTVTETQAESLRALALIRLKGRRTVTHAVLVEGISIAAVKTALRQHVRHSLPVAEDNNTIRKSEGCPTTFEHRHTPAWYDGRLTHEDLNERMRQTLKKAGML